MSKPSFLKETQAFHNFIDIKKYNKTWNDLIPNSIKRSSYLFSLANTVQKNLPSSASNTSELLLGAHKIKNISSEQIPSCSARKTYGKIHRKDVTPTHGQCLRNRNVLLQTEVEIIK